MSLLDLASLVLAPTATKEGKVYSAIPNTGDGDLSFTRATNGTRINSAGLIEKVRTNIYPYSQDFANAAWILIDTVKASTSETDPNGGTTAANITWTAGSGKYFYQNSQTQGFSTISFFVKSNGGGNKFRFFANGATLFSSDFTATSDWVRYSFVFIGNSTQGIGITNATDNSAGDLLVAFAQLELSDFGATDYIPTTTTAVSVGMLANVPRLDYSGGGCPKLLLEPQRTNLVTYSEEFNNWLIPPTFTTIETASLKGSIIFSNFGSAISQGITLTSNADTTISVFAKKSNWNFLQIRTVNFDTSASARTWFDLLNGTVGSTDIPSRHFNQSIEDYGNGWYRCSLTFKSITDLSGSIQLTGSQSDSSTISGANSGEDIFFDMSQVELGSYATSYIPTLSAASTRGADACSKTGISSLIGQTEGTLFAEINVNRTGINQNIELGDGTSSNRIDLRLNSNNNYQLVIVQGGVVVFNQIAAATFTQGQRIKLAAVYKSGDVTQLFVNGVSVLSATDRTITGSLTAIYSGSIGGSLDLINSPVNELIVFQTALTDTQAIELTTL